MVRKKQPPALNMKMYRHFAVLTMAATAMLAIFADGENREVVVEQAKAQQQKAADLAQRKSPVLTIRESKKQNSNSLAGFYASGSGAGDVIANNSGLENGSAIPSGRNPGSLSPMDLGISAEEYSRMSEAERRRLMQRAQKERQEQQQANAIRNAAAASAARSGITGERSEI